MPSTPLRVWYSFPDTLGSPGIGTTALNQVRGLAQAGVDLRVFCTFNAAVPPAGVAFTETLRVAGRRVPHRTLGVDRAYRWHDRMVAPALRRAAPAPDVVHAWPGGCLATFAAARRAGVVSLREAPSPHTASAFERAGRAAADLGLEVPVGHSHRDDPQRLATENAEFDAADLVLAPSDYVVRTFVERGYAPERLVRHRYGFDPVAFPAPPERDPGRPFTFAFVGRGEPNKGLHDALRAFVDAGLSGTGRFPDLWPHPAGLPDRDRRPAPAAGAEELGFVTDIGAVLRGADVLVLPTVAEGSALVVFEAMASGAVPVVSDAAGRRSTTVSTGWSTPPATSPRDGRPGGAAADPARLAAMRSRALARRDELTWRSEAPPPHRVRGGPTVAEAG